jgi:hypothetical protein
MPSRFGSASRYDRRGVTGAAYRPGLPPGLDLDALNKELKRQRDAEAKVARALTKTGRRAAKRAAKAAAAGALTKTKGRATRRAAKAAVAGALTKTERRAKKRAAKARGRR